MPVCTGVPLRDTEYNVAPEEAFQEMLMLPVPQAPAVAVRPVGVAGIEPQAGGAIVCGGVVLAAAEVPFELLAVTVYV